MSEVDDAMKVLKAFMKEMTAWEQKANQALDKLDNMEDDDGALDALEEKFLPLLEKIQDTYCAKSKWRRPGFELKWPSDYDWKRNKLLSATLDSPGKVSVEFEQQETSRCILKIELTQEAGEWKVVRRWMQFPGKKPIALEL